MFHRIAGGVLVQAPLAALSLSLHSARELSQIVHPTECNPKQEDHEEDYMYQRSAVVVTFVAGNDATSNVTNRQKLQ